MTSEQELSNAIVGEVELQDRGALVTVIGHEGQTATRFYPYMELHHLLFPAGILIDKLSGARCVFNFQTNHFVKLALLPGGETA